MKGKKLIWAPQKNWGKTRENFFRVVPQIPTHARFSSKQHRDRNEKEKPKNLDIWAAAGRNCSSHTLPSQWPRSWMQFSAKKNWWFGGWLSNSCVVRANKREEAGIGLAHLHSSLVIGHGVLNSPGKTFFPFYFWRLPLAITSFKVKTIWDNAWTAGLEGSIPRSFYQPRFHKNFWRKPALHYLYPVKVSSQSFQMPLCHQSGGRDRRGGQIEWRVNWPQWLCA